MTTAPTLSNGTEVESLPTLTTSASITKGEQITSILIAVGLLAILTICIVLLILRTVKTRHPDQLTLKRKDRRPVTLETHCMEDGVQPDVTSVTYTNPQPGNGRLVAGVREVPTRRVNKKWYDSTAIPFMDEGDYPPGTVYSF
ncbi:uncharacterized protein DEA37_0008429 [Paragonimus westermani]|uniref:Uncharacterized protein n=1 Tax=Paragonimus westermani TaxID=34504 RepID=A0A5J4NMZ4_9TREM|nr:uncharacterized protein DEA37_0008429 [Paragonimus westermani]